MTKNLQYFNNSERRLAALLAAGASALALGIAAPALAQTVDQVPDASEASDEDVDEVVVTGSRIRRPVDAATPITEIGSEQIERRGFTNIIDGLNEIPLVSGSVTNAGGNVQFGDNNAFVNLLNLGTNRTLTLVNGRRFVGANQATIFTPGNAPGAQVDLTIINNALIERTEIQTVGGGAVYGADAVAGVVNVVLKDDFEGLDVTAQGGFTDEIDGGNYRITGAWGKNFLDGRANITVAGEYSDADLIRGGGSRPFLAAQIAGFNNPLNGLNGPTASDGVSSVAFQGGIVNPLIPNNGIINTAQLLSGGTNNAFFPGTATQTSQDANFNNFVAQTGLTPLEFGAANPGIDPNLFIGTFGNAGLVPVVPNTDPATNGFLPNIAVPLGFNSNGDIVPFSFGNITPPNLADQNSVPGGDGFNDPTLVNLRSAQERIVLNASLRFDFNDNVRYKSNFIWADIENTSIEGALSNFVGGSATAGSRSIPIFVDDNPFLNDQARGVIADLRAQGLTLPQIDGRDVLFLGRNLNDLTGEIFSGNESRTFRTEQVIEGDFNKFNREFYWDVSFVYGRNTSDNNGGTNIRDIEFALATDVVADANGNPVCQQQTLDAPQDVGIRNPNAGTVNIAPEVGRTPTAAQVAACVPLNLFGAGNASQAAIDNILIDDPSRNVSEQLYAAASFGGEIIQLPAGALSFNSQFEWRRDSLEFIPGESFALGLARNTLGQGTEGALRYFEGGTEFLLPVFGGDFAPFGFERLELEGAVRVVSRNQTTVNEFSDSPEVTDVTFNAGGRWSPVDGVTFRGFRARSVRSASIVELFGAAQTGFTGFGGANHPCDEDNITGGPDSGIRAQNCALALNLLGLPADTLDGFQVPGSGRPAATGGNPFLQNEVADNWTVGVVLQPSFIPNLTIESDWFAIDIDGLAGLTATLNSCFDSTDFPVVSLAGTPACDQLVFTVDDGTGNFVIPEVNPLNGAALPSPAASALIGTTAGINSPFQFGFIQFPNLNQGGREFRALNSTIRYNFAAGDVFTPLGNFIGQDNLGSNWGDIFLSGTVLYIDRDDTSADGTFEDTDEAAGEPGTSQYQTRLDINHRLGKFSHQLQWFRNHQTVDDITNDSDLAELSPLFVNPSTNVFNYNVGYEFTDNITGRIVVNNLTQATTNRNFGLQGIGRSFVLSVQARF